MNPQAWIANQTATPLRSRAQWLVPQVLADLETELRSRRFGMTMEQMVEFTERGRRQVHRYIAALMAEGVPIEVVRHPSSPFKRVWRITE